MQVAQSKYAAVIHTYALILYIFFLSFLSPNQSWSSPEPMWWLWPSKVGICGLQWQKRLEKCTRTLSLSWVSPISGKAFRKFLSHTNEAARSACCVPAMHLLKITDLKHTQAPFTICRELHLRGNQFNAKKNSQSCFLKLGVGGHVLSSASSWGLCHLLISQCVCVCVLAELLNCKQIHLIL